VVPPVIAATCGCTLQGTKTRPRRGSKRHPGHGRPPGKPRRYTAVNDTSVRGWSRVAGGCATHQGITAVTTPRDSAPACNAPPEHRRKAPPRRQGSEKQQPHTGIRTQRVNRRSGETRGMHWPAAGLGVQERAEAVPLGLDPGRDHRRGGVKRVATQGRRGREKVRGNTGDIGRFGRQGHTLSEPMRSSECQTPDE
jgi:hypothetical protein